MSDSKDHNVFKFSHGRGIHEVPQIGFGTASVKGDECVETVQTALRTGYRMIDTALLYGNQEEVGRGVRASGLPRDEVWLTSKVGFFPPVDDPTRTKLWMYNNNNLKGRETTTASIDLSLQQLGVEYVDLMLIHNPTACAAEYSAATMPHFFEYLGRNADSPSAIRPATFADGEPLRPVLIEHKRAAVKQLTAAELDAAFKLRAETWAALEAAQAQGKCRFIGVSNYPAELLQEMRSYAKVLPQFNQLEMHPRFSSPQLRRVAEEMGVRLLGYGTSSALLIDTPAAVLAAAERTQRSSLQVAQRWLLLKGVVPLVRSRSPAHIEENFNVFDLELTAEEIAAIDAENRDYPYYWDPVASALTVRSASK